MKTKIFVLLLLFIGTSTFAQKLIDTKKVPSEVQRSFKRKASKAKEIKWFQVSKQIYLVKYKMGEWPAEAEFNREGTMLSLKQEIDPAKLPGKIQNELRQKHRDKKVFKAFNITKGRKDKYYSIILHKKQGRKKPPLVYEAQYSLAGKFITLWEPEVKNPQQATGPVRKTKFDEDVEEDVDELKERVRDEKISRKDLPSAAGKYLDDNFDYEYKAKEVLIKNNKKYGQYYYVVMKKQGEKKEHILYFDYKGNLLKKKVVDL
jgi:hypothetical protein